MTVSEKKDSPSNVLTQTFGGVIVRMEGNTITIDPSGKNPDTRLVLKGPLDFSFTAGSLELNPSSPEQNNTPSIITASVTQKSFNIGYVVPCGLYKDWTIFALNEENTVASLMESKQSVVDFIKKKYASKDNITFRTKYAAVSQQEMNHHIKNLQAQGHNESTRLWEEKDMLDILNNIIFCDENNSKTDIKLDNTPRIPRNTNFVWSNIVDQESGKAIAFNINSSDHTFTTMELDKNKTSYHTPITARCIQDVAVTDLIQSLQDGAAGPS